MNRQDTIDAIFAVANDEGTIQATDMVALTRSGVVPNDPRLHTTMSIQLALKAAGFSDGEIDAILDNC